MKRVVSLISKQLQQIRFAQYELQQFEKRLQALVNCCANLRVIVH